MCGRYTHLMTWSEIHRLYSLSNVPSGELPKRYNVAPTQVAPVVRQDDDGNRFASLLRWGLIPSWSDTPTVKYATFNARSEDASTKPAFRNAVAKRQRCLLPVSGFYEWQKLPGGTKKQPWYIGVKGGESFAFAGLWERWGREDETIESFTILTTTPNSFMLPLHNRMPCIVKPEHYTLWLDPSKQGFDTGPREVLQQFPAEQMQAWKVGGDVGRVTIDAPSLI